MTRLKRPLFLFDKKAEVEIALLHIPMMTLLALRNSWRRLLRCFSRGERVSLQATWTKWTGGFAIPQELLFLIYLEGGDGTVGDYLKSNGLYPSSTYFYLRTQPRHLSNDEFEDSQGIPPMKLESTPTACCATASTATHSTKDVAREVCKTIHANPKTLKSGRDFYESTFI